MTTFNALQRVLLGIGACGGATVYYFCTNKTEAHASWTTGYQASPFAKWDHNWDQSPQSLVKLRRTRSENDDNKINEDLENQKVTATRHMILIRHGQYHTNGKNDTERTLTAIGKKQAEFTARRLKELDLPYTDLIKSTMARAQETGTIISTSICDVPVSDCSLICEGAPVPPEPPVGHWKPEVFQFYQDGARIEAAFRHYFHRAEANQEKDSYTILVGHANVIRYFVCRALQLPPEAWLRLSLNHASITWISITPSGRVLLRTLGDSGHMPPNLITSR